MLARTRSRIVLIWMGIAMASGAVRADDWPQWLGPQRDGVWREKGLVEKFPEGGPPVKWRTPVGEGYSGPAVSQGKVIITDRILAQGAKNADPFATNTPVKGSERVLCLDEETGKILWKHEYDCVYQLSYAAGPRTTPVITADRVYTLGAMGDLLCLDLNKGNVIWSKNLVKEYKMEVPQWGFAGHPLIDGDRLICLVGGKDSVVVAFNKDTGKEIWRALSADKPGYAPPAIFDIDGTRQLILWHPESVNSLDPVTGKVYWTQPFPGKKAVKAALTISNPRLDGDRLFFTAFYDGPLMLQCKGTEPPKVLWRGKGRGEKPEQTDGLHSIMSTPYFKGGYIYGVCSYGELRCLKADTGERVWESLKATGGKSERWAHAFLIPQGDRFILFNEHGDLIIARLSPAGYDEVSRANILEPTNTMAAPRGRRVIWSHPAFADRCVFARNDREIVCVSLAADR